MKYNFDYPCDRKNTASLKWSVSENELPMWVADMDFETAPEIKSDIIKRAEHGVFGYTSIEQEWACAYTAWWEHRHNFRMEADWLVFCSGVVPAISSIVRKLTTPNENILIQTPVYNIFFNSIINNGRRVLESPLIYEDLCYHIDFEDLEKKLSDPQTTLMILCNPHNPIGKVWDSETLEKIGELCKKHNVIIVSDEIHCDLTDPQYEYVPFASVSEACAENSISCISPSKAFNLAGMQTAAVMIPNPIIRHKVWRALNTDEIAEPNAFATLAAISAFTRGEEWLDELRSYIYCNKQNASLFIGEKLPQIKLVPSNATYLMWLDCSQIADNTRRLADVIRRKTGLILIGGEEYGKCGESFVRMNIATDRARLDDGLQRLKKGVECYLEQLFP